MAFTITQPAPPGTLFAAGCAEGIVGDTVALQMTGQQVDSARVIAVEVRHGGRALAITLDVDEALGRYFDSARYLSERSCSDYPNSLDE